jgi:hypothetical protein
LINADADADPDLWCNSIFLMVFFNFFLMRVGCYLEHLHP